MIQNASRLYGIVPYRVALLESEGRLRKSDGSYRWFLIRYNPVRNGGKSPALVRCVYRYR
jgi:hypothetical protein